MDKWQQVVDTYRERVRIKRPFDELEDTKIMYNIKGKDLNERIN
jgi:hypothetical protein